MTFAGVTQKPHKSRMGVTRKPHKSRMGVTWMTWEMRSPTSQRSLTPHHSVLEMLGFGCFCSRDLPNLPTRFHQPTSAIVAPCYYYGLSTKCYESSCGPPAAVILLQACSSMSRGVYCAKELVSRAAMAIVAEWRRCLSAPHYPALPN